MTDQRVLDLIRIDDLLTEAHDSDNEVIPDETFDKVRGL